MILPPRKDDSCVLWLDFASVKNNTVYDQSKYHNDGKVYGAQHIGRFGLHGLSFDGVDDYAQIPNSPSLNPSSITVIALIKNLDYSVKYAGLLWKEGAYELEYRPLKRYVHFNRWIGGTKLWNFTAEGTLPSEGIIFLAGVYDETWTKAKIYCNGQSLEVRGDEQSGALDSSDNPIKLAVFHIGGLHTNENIYFLAEYNRALSDAEIRELYYYLTKGIRSIVPSRFVARKVG